jgi:hypothetical protein
MTIVSAGSNEWYAALSMNGRCQPGTSPMS